MTDGHAMLRYRAVVVGCGMGAFHAAELANLPDYELVGVCDLDENTAREVAEKTGRPNVYTDYAFMLEQEKPDVVFVATPNGSHARLTLMAAGVPGVKGIYCEKPMAVHMADARSMLEACRRRGIRLAVGHQRRMSAPYRTMRRLIDTGAIGRVYLMRASCAGDFLSDGTHGVDSLLYLNGDANVKWVIASMHRPEVEPGLPDQTDETIFTGRRYGHLVESGMVVTIEFDNGVRGELFTGDMKLPERDYQDIEIFGTEGRLWRAGDEAKPGVAIQDSAAGGWRAADDGTEPEEWTLGIRRVLKRYAESLRTGRPFPLDGNIAFQGFEVVMAAYESARIGKRIDLPLRQERFPLDIMMEEGRL